MPTGADLYGGDMENPKVGDRVFAAESSDEDEVRMFGVGVRLEDAVPDASVGGFGPILMRMGRTNPRIRLDSGDIVWGCECWWGAEAELDEMVSGRRVIAVPVPSKRAGRPEA